MILREHNVVVFVPLYEVTVANSGIRTKIEVLADECVKNMRRANEGLILPGELVYCDIKALDEEKTLFSQGVTNGTVLRTQRGGVAYATNDDRIPLGELQVMGSAPPPPNYAPALQDAPLDATTPGFPPKPGLTSPVQPTSEAPAPAIQQGIPPKFGVALPQNCNSPVPVQRYGVLARLGMPMQYFDCTGDKVYSNTAPAVLYRGGQVYYPPYGWQRFGLKVRGKYGSDAWLGNTNGPREYPVSYHGTSLSSAISIITNGYNGLIYSTADVKVAEGYARSRMQAGQQYLVVLMNRVHPSVPNKGGIYATPVPAYVRPYGLLLSALYS